MHRWPVHGHPQYAHPHNPQRPMAMLTMPSHGHHQQRHLQAHQVRRQVHRHPDPWYAATHRDKPLPDAIRIEQCAGDGIGAEVSESVKQIFKADNVPIEWEQVNVSGVETGNKHSEELFREAIASLKRNKLGALACMVVAVVLTALFWLVMGLR